MAGSMAATAAHTDIADLSGNFSGGKARLQLRNQLDALSVAPNSAAAALAAASVSLILTSAAENMEQWYSEDESELHEAMMLGEVLTFVTGPSCNQMAMDALSLELPNPVAKLGAICLDLSAAKAILERFAFNCSPRDNVLILCEALDRHSSVPVVNSASYFSILIDGIGKVLPLIQSHHAYNIKMALRVVIGCVKYSVSVLKEHNGRNAIGLFNAAFGFSNTVQEMCERMIDDEKEEVTTTLGLFALQNVALISQSKQEHSLSCGLLAIGYSQLAIQSGFSWKGLLCGDGIRSAIGKNNEGLGMSKLEFFSLAIEGAHLSVTWMNNYHNMLEILPAIAEVNLAWTDKWRAIQMCKYVLRSRNYQWQIKSWSLEFLSIFDESSSEEASQDERLVSVHIAIVMIKEIEGMRTSVPDESVHTKAYAAIKKIIRMLPQCERFTLLHELLKDRTCPISTGYLLEMVKEDINTECKLFDELQDYEALPPCFQDCLDFLFINLSRPYEDNLDSWGKVLDCLNLLRYLLMRGSRILPKPVVRRICLELIASLRYHLAARLSGNDDCTIHEELVWLVVWVVVDRCMTLAEDLVAAPVDG
ncbi:aberrant root formation protein 4 [Lolium perenne]|uniref:aberrant root formation protein 4 n=1 Tax=Lolium perenne TaxID=4522 RepID=UPI0021F5EC77|nr:aberrant root formation protein 4-like [Lolium perenne]